MTMTIKALLYSADAPDQEPDLATLVVGALHSRQLLWIDMVSPEAEEVAQVAGLLDCGAELLRVGGEASKRPALANYSGCFRITAKAVSLDGGAQATARPLTLVAGPNYVVSVHESGIDFVDELRDREKGDSTIGSLSSESFIASLLDWLLNTYFQALEVIVREIDTVEVSILARRVTRISPEVLEHLMHARRRVADLRRLLNSHRDVVPCPRAIAHIRR